MKQRKPPWQQRIAPEIMAAIGKPRAGERMGQYLLRWQRYQSEDAQRRLSAALGHKGEN